MRTTFRIYAAVAAVALGLLASCQQQAPETPGNDKLSGKELVAVTLQASMAQTKVTYAETTEKNLQPDWVKDDVVIGFDENSAPYEFTVSKVEADGSATLIGNAPANCTMHLVYLGGVTSDSTEGLSLPYPISYDEQAGDKTIPAVMFADGNIVFGGGEFHFSNAGAVIGINATKGVPGGSTISKITVYGDNLSAATVALDGDGRLALTAGGGTDESISTGDGFSATVSSDGKGTLVGNPVLIAVPAGAKVSKISVVVGSDNYIYTLKAPVTLARNEYKYVLGKTFVPSPIPTPTPEPLPGVFSVSETKKVRFSPGNLYYDGSEFKFESNQYDYRTYDGKNSCIGGTISAIGTPSGNWGLFGWSTNNTGNNFGMNTSTSINDYNGDFVDWGQNVIYEDPANTWYTLNSIEWQYLIDHHTHQWVNLLGVYGIVIAPDGITEIGTYSDAADWQAAEDAGFVFLPAAGNRSGTEVDSDNGNYWSSSGYGTYAHFLYFSSGSIYDDEYGRYYGRSVRLVTDVAAPGPTPGPTPDPIEDVDLGLPSGLRWASCNLGATSPEEFGNYFAWGDTEGYKPTGGTFSHNFNWANAPFNNGSPSFNSDYFNSVIGTVCPNDEGLLAPEYDAAHVQLGGTWHIPTISDFMELASNTSCSIVYDYEGTGVEGILLTSTVPGHTDQSLFLPFAGIARGTSLIIPMDGLKYWTSQYDYGDLRQQAFAVDYQSGISLCFAARCDGVPIRPVCSAE